MPEPLNYPWIVATVRAVRRARPDREGKVVVNILNLTGWDSIIGLEIITALRQAGNTVVAASCVAKGEDLAIVSGPDAGAEYTGDAWPFGTDLSARAEMVAPWKDRQLS